jgi:hypothetical protein
MSRLFPPRPQGGPAPGQGRITGHDQPMRGTMERVRGDKPDGGSIPELHQRHDNSTKHVRNSDERK